MKEWKEYFRIGITEMRPYEEGETLNNLISISDFDKENGSPKKGDMIARNKDDPDDQWLVAKEYFKENYHIYLSPYNEKNKK